MNEPGAGFRDPTVLTKWTRGLLYTSLAVSLASAYIGSVFVASGVEYEGSFVALVAAGMLWGMFVNLVALVTGILVLMWIYRANHNARQLGASDMEFTPGWAVGWYFVPIAWFWKPYQAMSEIWKASARPLNWREQSGSSLLGWWWALWLIPLWVLGLASFSVTRNMEEAAAERLEALYGIAINGLDVALALVLLVIIGRIHQMQMGHWSRQRTEAEEAQQPEE